MSIVLIAFVRRQENSKHYGELVFKYELFVVSIERDDAVENIHS